MMLKGRVIQIVSAVYDRIKVYKKQLNGLLILSIILFVVTTGVEQMTKQSNAEKKVLENENELLKAQLVEERLRTQLIYFVMLKQADSISIYKTRLINCQQVFLYETRNK
jgi:hypothetical protein